MGEASVITLDGGSLTLAELVRLARDPGLRVAFDAAAMERVARGWRRIERIGETYEAQYRAWKEGGARPTLDYGVTTGFGEFKDIPIHPRQLEQLQRNILLSHSVGVGENTDADDPANYFPAEVIRAVLVVRLNAFLKGCSGIRPELVECVGRMLDRGIVPLVPLRGSVGASGDLCPLAHLFAVLLGEGRYWVAREAGAMLPRPGAFKPASQLAEDLGSAPVAPRLKEGLALTNGATFCAAILALAVADAEEAANVADVAAALALEAVCGCARALDAKIHRARGLPGQIASAANLRRLVRGSRQMERSGAVQDVYSLRCAPQVHGASRDAVAYARMVVEREINAATDNPLFFPAEDGADHATDPFDFEFSANWPEGYRGDGRASYSAGNFHGQPLGLAADFVTVALAELADISERRVQLLLDHHLNRRLPANLIPQRGVNSGLMLIQYCAAAIVSENKVLSHPASVDSIPTSANAEDHVAMATHATRKLRTVLANAQAVLAIELLVAAQAVEWRVAMGISPTGDGDGAGAEEPSYREAREVLRRAETEAEAFASKTVEERRPRIAGQLGRGTGAAYLAVRRAASPMLADRPLDADIRRVRRLIEHSIAAGGSPLLRAVEEGLGAELERIAPLVGRTEPQ